MTESKAKRVIDIIQWILIAILIGVCAFIFSGKKETKTDRDIEKEETYIKIYESQTIEALKKENRALYDSLKLASDKTPESAIQIKYKYKFITDTIVKNQFVTEYVTDANNAVVDSVYHYTNDNDTIQTDINVKAKDIEWLHVKATINEKFTIINRVGSNGTNETTINHSPNVDIDGVTAWHRKKTFKDRIFVGPTIGAGYDPINKQFGTYIGVSVGFNLLK